MDIQSCTSESLSSPNADIKETDTTGSDVENRSQSSISDSLDSGQNGRKSGERKQNKTRLPKPIQRSATITYGSFASISSRAGTFVDSRLDQPNKHDRSAVKLDIDKCQSNFSNKLACQSGSECGSTPSLCRWNSDSKAHVRENTTSKMRFEKRHSVHEHDAEVEDVYRTPTQRKDERIRELKAHVQELQQAMEEREAEVEILKQNMADETTKLLETRDKGLEEVRKELEDMKTRYSDLTKSYEESVKAVTTLEDTMRELKEKIDTKEKDQEKIYLQMYRKGRQVAQIEREEELEDMMGKGIRSPSFTIRELVRKLAVTETELAKWQSLRRKESYEEGNKPESQSSATLQFLKDSFLHYLTDSKDSDDHLRAMIRIFNFSDEERQKIAKALLDRKNRK